MDRIELLWRLHWHLAIGLVVIHDLNIVRVAVTPREADAPAVVDSNAVCPGTVAFQEFQLVSRRNTQILQAQRPMQIQKLPPRRPFDRLKSANHAVLKERRGVRALERPDQVLVYDVVGITSSVMPPEGTLLWKGG